MLLELDAKLRSQTSTAATPIQVDAIENSIFSLKTKHKTHETLNLITADPKFTDQGSTNFVNQKIQLLMSPMERDKRTNFAKQQYED